MGEVDAGRAVRVLEDRLDTQFPPGTPLADLGGATWPGDVPDLEVGLPGDGGVERLRVEVGLVVSSDRMIAV
jgi:hypothetical protein